MNYRYCKSSNLFSVLCLLRPAHHYSSPNTELLPPVTSDILLLPSGTLPFDIRNCNTPIIFKRRLKVFLIIIRLPFASGTAAADHVLGCTVPQSICLSVISENFLPNL